MDGVGGGLGGAPTHVHMHAHGMHAHTCTCMHGKHDNFMQMAASIGFLGNPWEFPMMSYVCMCVCACMCVCMYVGGTLSPPPPPYTHPLERDPRNQSKFNSS